MSYHGINRENTKISNMPCIPTNIGVKVFNMLLFYIKAESDNPKKFKALLQKYLLENSFYSLNEYFELQS